MTHTKSSFSVVSHSCATMSVSFLVFFFFHLSILIHKHLISALRHIERLFLRLPQQVKFGDFRMYENLRVLAIFINSENELLKLLSGIRLMPRLQSFVLQYNPPEVSKPGT